MTIHEFKQTELGREMTDYDTITTGQSYSARVISGFSYLGRRYRAGQYVAIYIGSGSVSIY